MKTANLELRIGNESGAEKHIELLVVENEGRPAKVLFSIVWEDTELREWLSENQKAILNEELPSIAPQASCIAESVACFYDKEPDPAEVEFDVMHAYRTKHGFRFAMRGANIPDIYVGSFRGNHQVSVMENGRPFWSLVSLEGLFSRIV
ncbi:MAG TPA: hypothetical protein VG734_24970 [Lacunisphaera sp.]|nr:hypothetical protein [Lacunisphaera sp.]